MDIDRYGNDNLVQGGKLLGTNRSILLIRQAVERGTINTVSRITKSSERLDIIANQIYSDGRLWWVIAAASGIGWWLQIPPGTLLKIPVDLQQVENLL